MENKEKLFNILNEIDKTLINDFNAEGNSFFDRIASVEQYLRVIGINIKELKSMAKLDKCSDIKNIIVSIDEAKSNLSVLNYGAGCLSRIRQNPGSYSFDDYYDVEADSTQDEKEVKNNNNLSSKKIKYLLIFFVAGFILYFLFM